MKFQVVSSAEVEIKVAAEAVEIILVAVAAAEAAEEEAVVLTLAPSLATSSAVTPVASMPVVDPTPPIAS